MGYLSRLSAGSWWNCQTWTVCSAARFLAVAAVLLSFPTLSAFAQTQNSYPMLMSLRPVAVQVGQVTEREVSARYNLFGATRVLVSGDGVTGEVVPPEKKDSDKPQDASAPKPTVPKLKIRFSVAADAVPGPRDFRVITPQGASTVGQLVVVR